jgi:glycerol kinase
MAKPIALGVDQGTSGSRALILDDQGQVRGYGYRALPRIYPEPDRSNKTPWP